DAAPDDPATKLAGWFWFFGGARCLFRGSDHRRSFFRSRRRGYRGRDWFGGAWSGRVVSIGHSLFPSVADGALTKNPAPS
ncbi:MAG: hypothetical protein DMG23_15600, partial [Acidobacteria bacterium]